MREIIPTVLSLALLMGVIAFLPPLAKRLRVPYNIPLAILGMCLGLLTLLIPKGQSMGIVGDAISGLGSISVSSEVFLFVFLPILLFSGALSVNVRRLIDDMAPILILAVVAVLACTFFVGIVLAALFPVPLIGGLLLGAVIAATDPSAVVSIFRDLGAPRRLTLLVEGESLFNDAAAIVLFGFFSAVIAGGLMPDPGTVAMSGLWAFGGGLFLGGVTAYFAVEFSKFLGAHPVAEITLTVALAYISFIVATVYLDASGAVATVTAGLVLAARGRTRLSPESWERLSAIWEQLSFWAVSLIFVLAAMLVPRILTDLRWQDGAMLVVTIIAAAASRAVVVYGLLPSLAFLGQGSPIMSSHKLVLTWGGLRGAVTLALALAVIENPQIPPEISQFVAVMATGFLLFTLFVAGPSLRPLLRFLQLDRLTPREDALRERVLKLSSLAVRDRTLKFARDNAMEPRLVEGLLPSSEPTGDELKVGADTQTNSPDDAMLNEDLRLEIALVTLANQEEEVYYRQLADRTISPAFARQGIAVAERLGDSARIRGADGYRRIMSQELKLGWLFSLALIVHRHFGWERLLARALAARFDALLASQIVLRELRRFSRSSVIPLLGPRTGEQMRHLINERISSRQRWLEGVELQYPVYAEALRRRYLARTALRLEELEYQRKWSEALISDEVLSTLNADLSRRRDELMRPLTLDLGIKIKEMLARVPIFETLLDEQLDWVARHLKPHLALPGECIVKKGERGRSMYFVTAGNLKVLLSAGPVELSGGDFFGELALLRHEPRVADVVAEDCCHLLCLEKSDFRGLLRQVPELRAHIDAVAAERTES